MNAACNPAILNVSTCYWCHSVRKFFSVRNAKSLKILSVENADRPIVYSDASTNNRSSILLFPVILYLLSIMVSITVESCLLNFRNSASPMGSNSFSQCCPFSVQMFFGSRLRRRLNGTNNCFR